MRFTPRNTDRPDYSRKEMARGVAEELGVRSRYNGMPTCSYTAGPYTIERDGTIVGDDLNPIRDYLIHNGYANEDDFKAPSVASAMAEEATEERGAEETPQDGVADLEAPQPAPDVVDHVNIGIPIPDMTVHGLRNMLFMLYTKQYLLNRALDSELLEISEQLVDRLKEQLPESMDAFAEILERAQEAGELRGFCIRHGAATMTFPEDAREPEAWKLYAQFMHQLIHCAQGTKRTKPELQKPENERYYMHSWLIRLGCGGPDFKALRGKLLGRLNGYCAFPDEARAQRHKDKYREIRRIRREVNEEANRR